MRARRLLILFLLALLGLAALVPRGFWLTGRMPTVPLDLVTGGPAVPPVGRVWIDSDPACGVGPRTDPDDCFAILWLLDRGVEVAGIGTSFGNAPGAVVQDRMAALVRQMRAAGLELPAVHVGYPGPRDGSPEPPAVVALREALEAGPLTVLALGPLTNVAAALEGRPDLVPQVQRVVAVMGHEAGHLFHPSEGNRRGAFGHGPIFRDLNARVDIAAVNAVLALDLPLTLIPYDAGRRAEITAADLSVYALQGAVQARVAEEAQDWLGFWQREVGTEGFYPFDWVAAAYLLDPALFDCAQVRAEVRWEWALWLVPHRGLVVSPEPEGSTFYCPRTSPELKAVLLNP